MPGREPRCTGKENGAGNSLHIGKPLDAEVCVRSRPDIIGNARE